MKKRLFLLLLFLCGTLTSFSQTNISGTIKNKKGEPIFRASVILSRVADSTIVAYNFSDEKGFYEIATNSEDTALLISVYGFNVKKQVMEIENRSQTLDFTVVEEAVVLKEVSVKADKIWGENDTINYAVSAFRDTTDVVIADVLKKMPGIEVKDDGKVEYKGKPISKFYIENMDMLQGRYNLATTNIPAGDVATVQVMENHQPVKALKDTDFSDATALNIKLKEGAKGTFSMVADLGAGYDEQFLYDGKLAGMYFGKGHQYLTTLNGNNCGYNLVSNENITVRPFASIVKPSSPGIGESRCAFNNSMGLTFSMMHKLKNEAELSFNIIGAGDENKKSSYSHTVYYLPEADTIALSESMKSTEKSYNAEANIGYTVNKDLDYLGIKFILAGNKNINSSDIINETIINQDEDYHAVSAKGDIRWVRKSRKKEGKGIEIESHNSYGVLPYSMSTAPGSFPETLNVGNDYASSEQSIGFSSFESRNVLRFLSLFVYKRIKLFPAATVNVEQQQLTSDLNGISNDNTHIEFDGNLFGNDIKWLKVQPGIALTFDYDKRRIKARLSIPLQLRYISYTDIIHSTSYEPLKLLSQPYFNFKYKMNNRLDVSISSGLNNSTPTLSSLYSGYIMQNYRTLSCYDSRLSDRWANTSMFKLSYNNIMKYLLGELSVSYNIYRNEVMYSQSFENNLMVIHSVEQPSQGDYLSFSAYAGKGFSWKRLNINARGSYGFGRTPQLVQDKLATYNNQGWNVNLTASISLTDYIFFSNKCSWSMMKASLEGSGTSQAPINSLIENANISVVLPWNIEIGASVEFYHTSNEDNTHNFALLDCNVAYTYKKIKFTLNCTNLLDTKDFIYSYYSGIYSYYSAYSIRPRAVMLKAHFKVF